MQRKKKKVKTPTIVDVNSKQFDEILSRAEQGSLQESDAQLVYEILQSYAHLTGLIGDKNIRLARLKKLLFGATSEKTANVIGNKSPVDNRHQLTAASSKAENTAKTQEKSSPSGHGRNAADVYTGGDHEDCSHQNLEPGDACPACTGGTLYELATPGVIVRIVGQPPLKSTVYKLQKLRCGLCGKTFTADPPSEAGDKKYDATAASMIALLKYGSGLPFNRLDRLQQNLGVPLSASTQWDIVATVAEEIFPAYEALIKQAAAGDCVHNDDTTIKILERMKAAQLQNNTPGNNRVKSIQEDFDQGDNMSNGRTGTFTSGIVSVREGVRIALFFSGNQHAGENLDNVLQHRAAKLSAPIQMCDALSRNVPKNMETIVANCLAHARRNFVEVYDQFPTECEHLLNALQAVYRHDSTAHRRKFSPQRRLMYHRAKSKPIMDDLQKWLQRQLDEKLVEPNSSLGGAINYMLNRWENFTLFTRTAGVPLDNNICERALKKAILHRKNSLFYKTENGARIGDMYMSLIYTCELNQTNPLEYLTQLQRNQAELAENPENWQPWNYPKPAQAITQPQHTALQ